MVANAGSTRVATLANPALTAASVPVSTGNAGTLKVVAGQAKQPVAFATRKEIRRMLAADQDRFVDAILKMMENVAGQPQSSPYFKLAGHHGWPDSFCNHGVETFPAWHRAYLLSFEHALQQADKALGRDGLLALPYWDWTDTSLPDVIPAVLRRRLGTMPSSLVSEDNEIKQNGYSRLVTDARLKSLLAQNQLTGSSGRSSVVQQALSQRAHWMAASTESTSASSIETPHNLVHVLCGFPMSSIQYAAFHPLFFLHHCNIDRVYQAYLQANPDSQEEMARHQLSLLSRRLGRTLQVTDKSRPRTLYEQPLSPFTAPTSEPYLASNMLVADTRPLGYAYDTLPPVPVGQAMTEAPTLAVFADVDVAQVLALQSYMLHVFVLPPPEALAWELPSDPQTLHELPGYAGTTAVFGGKGEACDNCRAHRTPVTVTVDVSGALQALGLSRFEVAVQVAVESEAGGLMRLDAVPAIPAPTLEGPYFEDVRAVALSQHAQHRDPGNVVHASLSRQLQTALQRLGYYKDVIDGDFGPVTDAALRRLQSFYHLHVDGVAGPLTKGALLRTHCDLHEDADDVPEDTPTFTVGQVVTWWLGPPPGYLGVALVRREVVRALAEWAEVVPVFFHEVESAEEAALKIEWMDHTPDNLFKFDGPGGCLARATNGHVTLDESERWLLQGQPPTPHAFYLLPVLLHEVGHVLGLTHSELPDDVMAPFYEDRKLSLSSGDQERAVALYPLEAQYAQVFHALDRDGDGLLSRPELLQALTQHGTQPLSREEAEALWVDAEGRPGTSAGASATRTAAGEPAIDLKRFLQLITRYFFGEAPRS